MPAVLFIHLILGFATLIHCAWSWYRPRLAHTFSLNLLALATAYTGSLISQSFTHFCLRLGFYLLVIAVTQLRVYYHNRQLALLK